VASKHRAALGTAFRWAVPIYRRVQTAWSVAIDLALGVHTTPEYSKPVVTPSGTRPFGWTQAARLFHRYPLGPNDVLVDIGSGAGRVVLFGATRYACRKVIGVEQDERFDSVARLNVRAARFRARSPIELVHTDALEFNVPDDATVVFFFNPFEGEALDLLVAKLAASIDRRPRRLLFLYANPRSAEVLSRHPRLMLVDQMRSWRPDPEWARSCSVNVYDVVRGSDPQAGDVSARFRASDAPTARPHRARRTQRRRHAQRSNAGVVLDTVGDAGARVEQDRPEAGMGAGEVPLVDGVDGGIGDGLGESEL